MRYISSLLLLLAGTASCSLSRHPCLEPTPVTYHIKFIIVDTQGIDWYANHPGYHSDSLVRLIQTNTPGELLRVKCPVDTIVNGSPVFDCDLDFSSIPGPDRVYLLKLNENDVDTLTLQMEKEKSGSGR